MQKDKGSFCWKYIKLQLEKYRGVMFHDNEEWSKINLKKNQFVVSQITKICWILIRALKSLKDLPFDWPFLSEACNVWPKKSTEELSFLTMKIHAKFEEKLTCGLENGMRNLKHFHQNAWKCQNWYFYGILLSKIENAWAKNLKRSYV